MQLELVPFSPLTASQVCQRLHKIVEDSIELQYKIECTVYGMVDGDSEAFPVHERLERLRALQDAYMMGTPSEEILDIPALVFGSGTPVSLCGSIYTYVGDTRGVSTCSKFHRSTRDKRMTWVVGSTSIVSSM